MRKKAMHRIVISLTQEQMKKLKRSSKKTGTPIAGLIRQIIDWSDLLVK